MTKREQFIKLYSQYKAKGSEYNIPMQLSLCRLFEDLFSAEVVFNTLTDIEVETHDKINKNYMLADIVDILRIHFSIVSDTDMRISVEQRWIDGVTPSELEDLIKKLSINYEKNGSLFKISINSGVITAVLLMDKITLHYGNSPTVTVYSLEQFSSLIQILNQI